MNALIVPKNEKGLALVNFKWSELKCRCIWTDCVFTIMTGETLKSLNDLREDYNKPIKVNSAFRCNRHNEMIGGIENSNHKHGDAVDLTITGDRNDMLKFAVLARKYFKYVKAYETFIHCDNRMNVNYNEF